MIRGFIKSMLLEGKVEDLQKKYPDVDVSYVASRDPSPTKKYLAWMLKQIMNGHIEEDIVPTIQYFHQNIQSFKNKDINSYEDLKDLEEIVKDTELKRQEKDNAKLVGSAEKIHEDDSLLLVRPDDKNAVMKYGAGTKWCITMRDATYYEDYTANNTIFYFLIDKSRSSNDPYHKVALAVERNDNNEVVDVTYFNAPDDEIDYNDVLILFASEKRNLISNLLAKAEYDAEERPKPWPAKFLSKLRIVKKYNPPFYTQINNITFEKPNEPSDGFITDFWKEAVEQRNKQARKTLNDDEERFLSFLSYRQQNLIAKIDDEVNELIESGHWFIIDDDLNTIRMPDNNISYGEVWRRINDDKIFLLRQIGNRSIKIEAKNCDGEIDFIKYNDIGAEHLEHGKDAVSTQPLSAYKKYTLLEP